MKNDNTIDITQRLKEAAEERSADVKRDNSLDRIARILRGLDPLDQMHAICAYQSALILELSDGDRDRAAGIWQASWALSTHMMQDMFDYHPKNTH